MPNKNQKKETRKVMCPKSLDEFKKLITAGSMINISGVCGSYVVDRTGDMITIEDIDSAPTFLHGKFKDVQDMLDGFVICDKPLRDYWNKASVRPF